METIDSVISRYNKNIYDRYKSLINSGISKEEYTNNHLCKIFEYYSCIQLMKEYNQIFLEYDDIDPNFKEINDMSRTDTGVDACNLIDTIVQCKLRKDNTSLTWRECGTFFGSQNIFNEELKEIVVRWKKMIITRNKDCNLSRHLSSKSKLFIDKDYDKNEMIVYCEELLKNYIEIEQEVNNTSIVLRDYQLECIKLIKEAVVKNVIINLPTGTGKNLIILHSMKIDIKYLILVPRIILMTQIKDELKKYFPKLSRSVQCIGDGNDTYKENKNICICVYNSISVVKDYVEGFSKIFIDEAHHIKTPMIYQQDLLYFNEDRDSFLLKSPAINNRVNEVEAPLAEALAENPVCKCEKNDISNDENNDSDEEEEQDFEEEEDCEEVVEETEETNDVDNEDTYLKEIALLAKYNNNVYLSATIDKQDGFEYYTKDIREMIKDGYLCDYTIHIPIFTEDPTNKNICYNLIKNYSNTIIYCNSQKEGNAINKMMNSIQKGCSQYIDCKTSKNKRDIIIKKYKSGKIPFLVNVRILVEGFDAPITKGICFMHLPSSSTTLIQIIGRALRLHKDKTIANIILPFSSKGDETSICRFLNIIAKNDSRVRKSYEVKKLGGYINIDKVSYVDEEVDSSTDDSDNDIELKFNMVFDSMGKIANCEELWNMRLDKLKKYIDDNGKRPKENDINKDIKQLFKWIQHQITNYNKKQKNMKDDNIYNKWNEFINSEKYKQYFILPSSEEHFIANLNKVKKYIDENNKLPYYNDNDTNIKILSKWVQHQTTNYKNKQDNMKHNNIYNKWTEFINSEKYKKYFIVFTAEENFIVSLNKVKIYLDENHKRPSRDKKNKDITQLGEWIHTQISNYNTKINNMKDINIYNKWTEFINCDKYKIYFQSQYEDFIINLNKVIKYIDKNEKRPQQKDKDETIRVLGIWISNQACNYNKKRENMKDENIYNKWNEFKNDEKYKKYFKL